MQRHHAVGLVRHAGLKTFAFLVECRRARTKYRRGKLAPSHAVNDALDFSLHLSQSALGSGTSGALLGGEATPLFVVGPHEFCDHLWMSKLGTECRDDCRLDRIEIK